MSFPITANLDDSLKVEIHLHQFYLGDRDRSCWTYLTRGMEKHGQEEMCLSLLVGDDVSIEDFPKTPIKMFQLLADRTKSGRSVTSGDSTRLGQKGIFGFPALFYVPSIQYEGLPALDEYLGLILIHQEEYDYAHQYGLTRFLSRLGKFCSSFPYPTWNTAARPSLFTSKAREASLLSEPSHASADYSYVHQLDDVLQLQLHNNDAEKVEQALANLPTDHVAIINTAFSPRCDASLYWQEGQEYPGAYAAPEASTGLLGGSFITLGFSQLADLSIEEDGFSVVFTETDWPAFCDAIRNKKSFEADLPDGRKFVLDYVDTSARARARPYDPVATWKNLKQPMKTATPTPTTRPVRSGNYDNLSGSSSLDESVSKADLLAYIARIEVTLAEAMSEETESFVLEIELNIGTGEVKSGVLANIDLNPEFIAFIRETVEAIEPCGVTFPVQISVPFYINQD